MDPCFLALDSSDSLSPDEENDFLYGDIGMAFEIPFRASLGTGGKSGNVSPPSSCRRSEAYGTAGHTGLDLLGNLYVLGL
jgi:hypothetical protein